MAGARELLNRSSCCNSNGLLPPLRSLAATAIALAVTACTVTPTPLTEEDIRTRVVSDQKMLFAGQEPVVR